MASVFMTHFVADGISVAQCRITSPPFSSSFADTSSVSMSAACAVVENVPDNVCQRLNSGLEKDV